MKYFRKHFWYILIALMILSVSIFYFLNLRSYEYSAKGETYSNTLKSEANGAIPIPKIPTPPPIVHLPTPKELKAVYISAWTAGSSVPRDRIISLIESTELNAIVIDIKDSTGYISFEVSDPYLKGFGTTQKRIRDIVSLTKMLHDKNIYIIGRVSVFQDSVMTKKYPEWSMIRKSDGLVWTDRKGMSFMDPANPNVLKYTTAIAKEAYALGFDEINFDYIRYPSDGNIKDINYQLKEGETRRDHMREFFVNLNKEVKSTDNIITSADLFGLTTTEKTDMGIGQVIEDAIPNFDYIAPMVYPSHFGSGFNGFKIPAEKPYEVINITMKSAIARSVAMGFTADKIRPWLQDFSIKDNGHYVKYTPELVRAQIKGANDAGINSWMLWDPSNKYTASALLPTTDANGIDASSNQQ